MRLRSIELTVISLGWGVAFLGLAGCGLEPVSSPTVVTDPTQLYMALRFEHRAINLSTATGYNTVQLAATPRDGRGDVMTGLPAPTYQLENVSDTSYLQVTPEGLVTARQPASEIDVIAELLVSGPVRHADTVHINVQDLATPPALASFSIDPVPPDSANWPLGSGFFFGSGGPPILQPHAFDAAGQSIDGLVVEYVSLDPTVAKVNQWTGVVETRRPGQVRMVANTMAYGTTQTDTALFTVLWPTSGSILIQQGPDGAVVFAPSEVRVVPYGVITWQNMLPDSMDVVFDEPTNVAEPVTGAVADLCAAFEGFTGDPDICAAGNMLIGANSDPEAYTGWFRVRQFPVAGTYRYHSTRTGAAGQIIVTDELPVGTAP